MTWSYGQIIQQAKSLDYDAKPSFITSKPLLIELIARLGGTEVYLRHDEDSWGGCTFRSPLSESTNVKELCA